MTQTMTASAARKASKKTQHVRSTGDWITLIVLIAAALLVLFPLLVLTVNAFKTPADYNATGPLSLPKHFTMDGIISFWTTTKFPLKFWNSLVISLVVAVAAVVLSVLNSFALGIGRVKGNTWIVLAIMLANMMPHQQLNSNAAMLDAAAKFSEKGVKMFASWQDIMNMQFSNREQPWVVDDKLIIDDSML